MNYERIMLNGAKRMKSDAGFYNMKAKKIALNSFYKTDTLAQIDRILRWQEKAEYCRMFYDTAYRALQLTQIGYRALLTEIYLSKTDPKILCAKYRVSLMTLYRKLSRARFAFRCCLKMLGASEQWFYDLYGDLPWVKEMSKFQPGRGGRLAA